MKPRPELMKDARLRAVRLMLSDPSCLELSNADFALRLNAEMPGYAAPPTFLTEPFKMKERKALSGILREQGVALTTPLPTTPSKLKLALRAYKAGSSASVRAVVEVVFTSDAVIVGNRTFSINDKRHRRIQTKRGKLGVAALLELLLDQTE